MGLCLSVKKDHELVIGNIRIKFKHVCAGTNKILIDAPKDMEIKLNKLEPVEPHVVKVDSTLK